MTVLCDLPGCDRDRIDVRADDNRIEIRAERDEAPDEGRIHRSERPSRVERSIELPASADVEEADASYENGVLRIDLPKQQAEVDRLIGIE